MANRSEAYDFSYFEDISSVSAVIDDYAEQAYGLSQQEPQIEEKPRENVVELPQQRPHHEPEQRRRPKRSLLKMAAAMLSFTLVFTASFTAVYSEVQLTELNEKINIAKSDLEEAESLQVQLTMQAAQKMTDAQVEQYAVEQLGMGKLSSSQVVYLHVAQQDKGTVVQENAGGSWMDRLFETVRGWFA